MLNIDSAAEYVRKQMANYTNDLQITNVRPSTDDPENALDVEGTYYCEGKRWGFLWTVWVERKESMGNTIEYLYGEW